MNTKNIKENKQEMDRKWTQNENKMNRKWT